MPTYKFAFPNTSIEWLKQFGIATFYALLLYVGEFFFESEAIVGHFEPASGLALAALLIGGKRYAGGIFIGAALIHIISGGAYGKPSRSLRAMHWRRFVAHGCLLAMAGLICASNRCMTTCG